LSQLRRSDPGLLVDTIGLHQLWARDRRLVAGQYGSPLLDGVTRDAVSSGTVYRAAACDSKSARSCSEGCLASLECFKQAFRNVCVETERFFLRSESALPIDNSAAIFHVPQRERAAFQPEFHAWNVRLFQRGVHEE
jgi:hypothetical protein